MRTSSIGLSLTVSSLIFAGCGGADTGSVATTQGEALSAGTAMLPTSDVAKNEVVGVGNTTSLYDDVNDGSSFTSADDDTSYVRGAAGVATASHTVGYSGGPSGTVTQVTVSYRAQRGSAQGTAQALLYDGSTLVASGKVNTMGAWADYQDTFTNLSVSSASHLRTKMVFHNTAGTGAIRYTQIWLNVVTSGTDGGVAEAGSDGGTIADAEAGTDAVASDSGTTSDASSGDGGTTSGSIKTVFLIVMENHNWSQIKGSSSAPYINGTLLPMASHAENYYDNPKAVHPSEPNYIWLEAGDNLGITNDDAPSVNHQSTTSHLSTLLKNAGVSWKAYEEDISGTVCPLTGVNLYAPKHDPFVFFDDSTGTLNSSNAYCIAHNRPFTELATDLANGTVARYNFITPNLCDDMHNSSGCATSDSIKNGDTWLSQHVPTILGSAAYKNDGALFITWDESEGGEYPIGMIVLSPLAKGHGYSNTIRYYHSSMLRTVQEVFGVTPLLRDAANQQDLRDLFVSFP